MNSVLRENLEVLFSQKYVLPIYVYLLILLGPIEFGALYSQSLGEQMWRGSGLLLRVCSTAALVMIVYFALRLANHEYASERFERLEHWLIESRRSVGTVARGRETSLLVHIACLVFLCAPLLAWAAATSHAPLTSLFAALALIAFYAFCYGVWGLVASVLWQGERENREFAARLFTFIVVVAALAVYLPLNPVIFLLAVLGRDELAPLGIAGWTLPPAAVHFAFHGLLGGYGLFAHRWALKRLAGHGHG